MQNKNHQQLQVFGISNCDSCRAARKWLDSRDVPHRFHDFRQHGVDADEVSRWLSSEHAAKLLNRRSTSWRQLSAEQKSRAETDTLALLLEHPTLIKRPVFTLGEAVLAVGFSPEQLTEFI